MKPSQLKKDRRDTIRTNTEIKEKLARKGLSIQDVFDQKIDELFACEVSLKAVTPEKSREK
jgi:hypothetical protein